MGSSLRASYRFCEQLAQREAKNFFYSFLLLPPDRRRSMCALYAYMRQTDDLADEPGDPGLKAEALVDWRRQVDRAINAGQSAYWPGLPALADTVKRHQIPLKHLTDVIEGVQMDLVPRAYGTFDELYRYCYLVASAVGLSCLHIWGYRSEHGQAEKLAESCGIALQLTNIVRDVREDARLGRVYLPREDLERFGVTSADLEGQCVGPELRSLLEYESKRAYTYYQQAMPLVELVSPLGRPVLRTITGIYRGLLDEITRRDYEVLSRKVRLPGWKKSAIAVRSLVGV